MVHLLFHDRPDAQDVILGRTDFSEKYWEMAGAIAASAKRSLGHLISDPELDELETEVNKHDFQCFVDLSKESEEFRTARRALFKAKHDFYSIFLRMDGFTCSLLNAIVFLLPTRQQYDEAISSMTRAEVQYVGTIARYFPRHRTLLEDLKYQLQMYPTHLAESRLYPHISLCEPVRPSTNR